MNDLFFIIFILLSLVVAFWFYILLPAGMAERRGRSQFVWILISFITSPILACLILWVLGNTEEPSS